MYHKHSCKLNIHIKISSSCNLFMYILSIDLNFKSNNVGVSLMGASLMIQEISFVKVTGRIIWSECKTIVKYDFPPNFICIYKIESESLYSHFKLNICRLSFLLGLKIHLLTRLIFFFNLFNLKTYNSMIYCVYNKPITPLYNIEISLIRKQVSPKFLSISYSNYHTILLGNVWPKITKQQTDFD